MIDLVNVTKRFAGVTAVDRVSLHVEPGEIAGFLGPNGAGKTTSMRMMAGYFPPTSGTIRIDGVSATENSLEVRRRIGYLPESVPLPADLRVREYLAYRARLKGVRGRCERARRIDRVVEACGLEEVRRRPIAQLSKGYRQRTGLADVLIHDPAVLILDEPTVGLDPAQVREIRTLIRRLGEGHTVLLSTHILSEVESVCDRVLILRRGRLVFDARMDAVPPGKLEETFLQTVGGAENGEEAGR